MEKIIKELLCMIQQYEHSSLSIQISVLEQLLLSNIDLLEVDELNKMKNLLFPPRGGLSEYYIWVNDFYQRKQINDRLEYLITELWNGLKR